MPTTDRVSEQRINALAMNVIRIVNIMGRDKKLRILDGPQDDQIVERLNATLDTRDRREERRCWNIYSTDNQRLTTRRDSHVTTEP